MILSYIRTVVLYLVLIFVSRLMGKRQIGQMEPSEFVVTMLVANLASIPMQDPSIPVVNGFVPILTVFGCELLLSVFCMHSVKLRKLLCGKPVILIENGKILQSNLRKTCVNLDELSCLLRQKDILDPRTVQYAILETNGTLSVFPYPQYSPANAGDAGICTEKQYLPVTLICDGKLIPENLRLSGRDEKWLQKTLKARNCRTEQVLLLTVDKTGEIIFFEKDF